MPSLLGHAVAGIAITSACSDGRLPRRTWPLAVFCAVAPDLDWFVGLAGLHRGHFLNHRGLAHSLGAALVLAAAVLLLGYRREWRGSRVWSSLSLAALSHGLLDTCTSGGVGVALFAPFSSTRWACIWQPGWVAPLPLNPEHTSTFLASLGSEAVWIGLPALAVILGSRLIRQVSVVPSLREVVPENG